MKQKLYRKLIELTNGKYSSYILRTFSTSRISRFVIPLYVKTYRIDLSDIASEVKDFKSLHDFFIRTLNDEARLVDEKINSVVCPVDGTIETFGAIKKDGTFYVKGLPYSLYDLVKDENLQKRFDEGCFIVFYLSPANYHRIHSPVTGVVMNQYTLGQKSYPVNRLGLMYGKSPISGNYRKITELKTDNGNALAVIKVGAMFVNSIEVTNTNQRWVKGEEIGYFSFGSTVVLLFEKDTIQLSNEMISGKKVRMGEHIGNMV